MDNQRKQPSKYFRRIFTLALLIAVIIQLITVINIFTGFLGTETGTVHIITGLAIFGLIIIHFVFFRKSFVFLFK